MLTLNTTGACYRTRCMDLERAARFARCLGANPRFARVTIEESGRAKGSNRYFVQYAPVNGEQLAARMADQQEQRAARAAAEGHGYTFCRDLIGGNVFHWCLSTSGEVYEVTPRSCSCPDRHYRGNANNLACKHMIALVNGQGTAVSF